MELLLLKPKLYYVDSTLYSILLRWEVETTENELIYRIEMKDSTYIWVTKYWGKKTHCEIKGLCPETLYYFRLTVSLQHRGEKIQSEILTTATKVGPPILFYLFKSAERGDVEGLKNFFSERKDSAALDAFDKKGETALIKGVKKGSKEAVAMLISAGVDVNHGALGTNRTSLMYACSLGNLEIAKILIENGADVNFTDNNNCGPLHYGVDYSQLELVKLCLELGSDINMRDAAGWTPLMRAVILNSNESVVKELLVRQADIAASDRNGQTALSLAKLNRNECHISLLSEYEEQMKKGEEDIQIKTEADDSKTDKNGERNDCNASIQLEIVNENIFNDQTEN